MLKEINNKVKWPEILLFIYFVLKPFYLSDCPMQIADFVLLLVFAYCILNKQKIAFSIPFHTKRAFVLWCCLTVYVCLVNYIWYLYLNCGPEIYETGRLLKSTLYFIFNGIAIYTVLNLYTILGEHLYRVFVYSAFASVLVQVIMSVVLYDPTTSRQVIAFSNPNQLGYYAIIMLTIGVLWGEFLKHSQLLFLMLGTVYLNLISLSKAGIIASLVLVAFCIAYRYNNKGIFQRKNKLLLIMIGVGCITILFLFENLYGENSLLNQVFIRIAKMGMEADSALGNGRGYNRLFEIGINIFWGMGEGAYERFAVMSGNEVHSTYFSILTSYGLIGFVLWLLCMIEFLLRKSNIWFVLVSLSGVTLYWITHNGVRNTMLWMVIALLSVCVQPVIKQKNERMMKR